MKAKRIFAHLFVAILPFLTGCSVRIVNMTPHELMTTPSGSYTLKAQAKVEQEKVLLPSLKASVVIDGQQYSMKKDHSSANLFEYNYQPPFGKRLTRFYYVLDYAVQKRNRAPIQKQIISDIYQVRLPNPMQPKLAQTRAAVDTQVSISGRQFSSKDIVIIDGALCETTVVSSQELHFIVPDLKPGFGYEVQVNTITGLQHAGFLRIDAANPLSVLPKKLALRLGQQQAIAFVLSYPAPSGGLYINITTDIPDSITMPEVIMPEGARTVSATVKGNTIGNGNLFIKAGSLPEITIPLTIRY